MKVTINKSDFINALKRLNLIKNNNTLPILNAVLLQAEDTFTLTKTNLEITAITYIELKETKEKGKVVIDFNLLNKVIPNLPKEIKIETKDNILKIGKYKLTTYKVEDFPKIENVKTDRTIKINKNFNELIPFVAKESGNFELTNIYFGKNYVSATDGKRAIVRKTDIDADFMLKPELANYLIENIYIGENDIIVKVPDVIYFQRKIEGKFPDIKQHIPKHTDYIEVNKTELTNLTKATLPLISDLYSIKLEITKNMLTVSKESEKGTFKDSIECKSTKDLTIGVNANYLLDFLKAIDENDDIKIYFKDYQSPIHYKNEEKDILLMPVQL